MSQAGFFIKSLATDWDGRTIYEAEYKAQEDDGTMYLGDGYKLGGAVKLDDIMTNIVQVSWGEGDNLQHGGYWVPMETKPSVFTSFWKSLDEGDASPQPLIAPGAYYFQHDLCDAIAAFEQAA